MTLEAITLALCLGIGLSASTGLNTFIPLLLLGAAARFNIAGISLGDSYAWLASDTAMIVLIVAAILEIIADKIPSVDHVLDSLGTVLRPAAGALAVASVFDQVEPVTAAVLGIIIGSPISLGFHTLKAATRVGSTATTFGCANPVLSLVEDLISAALSILAIFAPVVVPLLVVLLVIVAWRIVRRLRATGAPPPAAADSGR